MFRLKFNKIKDLKFIKKQIITIIIIVIVK